MALRRVHSKSLNLLTRLVHAADGTAARRAQLEAFDYLPREQQEQVAMARLRSLLEHAFTNVPYWSKVAGERGLKPEDFETYADLQKLPVMTKDVIRDNLPAMRAYEGIARHVKRGFTGGSTGQPLTFYYDAEYTHYSAADKARCYERCNYQYGQPLVFIWGSDYDSAAHKSLANRIADRLGRNLLWVDTFDLSEMILEEQAVRIALHRPALIVGYVSSLTMYARYLQTHACPRPAPKGIQATAETLTAPDRGLLEDTFCCKVFDRYGGREVGLLAHECDAHQGLHLSPLCNVTELLHSDDVPVGVGEIGRVIVTNLHNRAMPFIRYEAEDLAVASDQICTCGRTTAMLERVVGRTADIIVCPSGRLLPGEFFTHQFGRSLAGTDAVKQYQVVQETSRDLRIRLVPRQGADLDAVQTHLAKVIREHADPHFVITFEICDHIASSASGKYRFTISKLQQPFARTADRT